VHAFFLPLRQRATITLTGTLVLFAFASLIFSGMTGSVSIPLADIPAAR
jgi:iron complex transport system permease protein